MRKTKKLTLARETLLRLAHENLQAVQGGQSLAPSFCCSMTCYPCTVQTGTNCNVSVCICD